MVNSIPKGYKRTKIGIIPEDWEVKKLGEVFEISAGGDINTSNFSSTKTNVYKYPIYSNSLNNAGLYGYSSEYRFKENSITVTARGTLGFAVPRFEKFNAIIRLLVLYPKFSVDIKFISEYINERIEFFVENTSVPQLTAPQISKYYIPLPPISEQRTIARVLSDFDELIESLDKLIEKKKAIKKGAMQELLTGKKRLQGFSGKWVRKKLGEIFTNLKGKGLSKTKLDKRGKYECILYGELFTTYKEVIIDVKSRTNFFEGVPSIYGDILLPASTTTTGIDLAKASTILKDNILLGGDIIILRSVQKVDPVFISYYLNEIKKYNIAEKTHGITIYHLQGKDLLDIEISLPPTLEEQRAIAQILSDMDEEIEALEKKKEKYKMLKKGAMELLLTGKVRLKDYKKGEAH